jgi:hypothetical protein
MLDAMLDVLLDALSQITFRELGTFSNFESVLLFPAVQLEQ